MVKLILRWFISYPIIFVVLLGTSFLWLPFVLDMLIEWTFE